MFNLVLMCKLTTTVYHSRPIAIAMFASYDPPYLKKKASDISKKTYGKCSEGITYC